MDSSTAIAIALITGATAVMAAVGGAIGGRLAEAWAAKRSGVPPLRKELIEVLEATAQARADRITQLEAELRNERAARSDLETRVARLEKALDNCLSRLTAAHLGVSLEE